MVQIIILLDTITHTPARCSEMFRILQLQGHYYSAVEFQNKFPQTHIVRRNHLTSLKKWFQRVEDPTEHLIVVYCGHGMPGKWCVGINRTKLLEITSTVPNRLTVVSDSCFSDSMNIAGSRANTDFISAARAVSKSGDSDDDNTSAFFTVDGGYLSCNFYQEFSETASTTDLKKKLLQHYYDDGESNAHWPRFF
jgi:hypothetical protein